MQYAIVACDLLERISFVIQVQFTYMDTPTDCVGVCVHTRCIYRSKPSTQMITFSPVVCISLLQTVAVPVFAFPSVARVYSIEGPFPSFQHPTLAFTHSYVRSKPIAKKITKDRWSTKDNKIKRKTKLENLITYNVTTMHGGSE